MNIETIKEKLQSCKGRVINFRFNGSRNQIEEFQGIIENIYNYVFTIKLKEKNIIRSFSYVDILIDSLEVHIY